MTEIRCDSCETRNRVRPTASGTPRCGRCHEPLPWLVEATPETFDAEIQASVPVLVDFWAAWCAPCRAVAPVLEQIARRHAGRVKVVKVDADRAQALAARFGARSIPLLVVIREGREVDRIVGAQPRAAIEARLGLDLGVRST
jgi:thioredoxin 2